MKLLPVAPETTHEQINDKHK